MLQYSALKLTEQFNNYVADKDVPIGRLNDLSKVNILVGANNSGKSRFLRSLARIENYHFDASNYSINTINQEIEKLIKELTEFFRRNSLESIGEISVGSIERHSKIYWLSHHRTELFQLRENLLKKIIEMSPNPSFSTSGQIANIGKKSEELKIIGKKFAPFFDQSPDRADSPRRVYLPVLRGLRPLDLKPDQDNSPDFYKNRTLKDYFTDNRSEPTVFTGQNLYSEIRDLLLGNHEQRKSINDFENFLSESFFDNQTTTLIPRTNQDVVFVRIGSEERPIYDLGDGIQALILVAFPIFKAEKRTLFFIEEPETHMHPGMQRKLIELLCNFERDHQFFLTTHSNHFLDLTFDYSNISIYSFSKKDNDRVDDTTPKFLVNFESSGEKNLLKELGVRNSSVFLANATIWVEGITDRWYFRRFLEEYQNSPLRNGPKFKEDIHFVFVEYGGGNITHWSFLDEEEQPINVDRLCSRSMLIADKDGNSKLERAKQLNDKLEDRFVRLPVREVENLLSPVELQVVLFTYEKTNIQFTESHDSYKNVYLGKFLDDYFDQKGRKERRGKYAAKSGTVSDKKNFCQKAVAGITWKTMSDEAKEVAHKIYEFIARKNG